LEEIAMRCASLSRVIVLLAGVCCLSVTFALAQEKASFKMPMEAAVFDVAILGRRIAVATDDGAVRFYDAETGRLLKTMSTGDNAKPINSIAMGKGGVMATGGADSLVRLWDTGKEKEKIKPLSIHKDNVTVVVFTPDGRYLATGSKDGTVRVLDLDLNRPRTNFTACKDGVKTLAFSPDGKVLASGGADGKIKFWNPATGKSTRTLDGHSDAVASLSFSPSGDAMASGSWDGTIRLWDVESGKETAVLKGHEGKVRAVSMGPFGRTVASAGDDRSIRIWNTKDMKVVATLKGHEDMISAAVFSGDGKTLASGSKDGTVRLWNVEMITGVGN
jgi:WD40 repeat protein